MSNKFWMNKIQGKKKDCPKNVSSLKFGMPKICIQTNLGSKKFRVQKHFVSKQIWVPKD